MCAITGWSGKLPKGLLTELLKEGEERGRDSTGIAYRGVNEKGAPANFSCRHILNARRFVTENGTAMSAARRSLRGLGHTRRASPGMPIDNLNAHPFVHYRCFFAHNGRIVNWVELRDSLRAKAQQALSEADLAVERLLEECPNKDVVDKATKIWTVELDVPVSKRQPIEQDLVRLTEYHPKLGAAVRASIDLRLDVLYLSPKKCQTDSMVLGPFIKERDFSRVVGCMALVWMVGSNVYTFRYGKEAVAAQLTWKYTDPAARGSDDPPLNEEQTVTLVASTEAMIRNSLKKLSGVDYECRFVPYEEDHCYRLEPLGLVDEGLIPVSERVFDEFSSQTVPTEPTCELTNGIDDGDNVGTD